MQKSTILCNFIKHALFLHPEKRNKVGSTSTILKLAKKITKALGNRGIKVFHVDESEVSSNLW